MNNRKLKITAFAAVTGVALLAGFNAISQNLAPSAVSPSAVPAATVVPVAIQPEFPLITSQPQDQMVPFGSNATFTVTAVNADSYQWLLNGNQLASQTSNSLTITNCGISNVGYYSCYAYKNGEGVPTRAASLMVYTNSTDPQTGVDPVVVFGLPLLGGGSQGTCPGHYTGYINYTKTIHKAGAGRRTPPTATPSSPPPTPTGWTQKLNMAGSMAITGAIRPPSPSRIRP